eukprot:PITA_32961
MNNNIFEECMNEHKKLDGSNYANWNFNMQTLLEAQSAWKIVNGDEPKPATRLATIPDWEKRKSRARKMLKMLVKDCIISHIRECKYTDVGRREEIDSEALECRSCFNGEEELQSESKSTIENRSKFTETTKSNLSYKEENESSEWKTTMEQEYNSIIRNNTWELVELPRGKQVIGCKWLYKLEINADGTIEKLKARLVAKGYKQKEGIYYEETFAPVAKLNTIRMLIALATKKHWMMHQLDVKSTFLNGEPKEEVSLEKPEGFVQKGK